MRVYGVVDVDRAPGAHWIGWVRPRTSLEDVEKRKFLPLPGLGTPTPPLSSLQLLAIQTVPSQLQNSSNAYETFEKYRGKKREGIELARKLIQKKLELKIY
jgi:hypothetical protein